MRQKKHREETSAFFPFFAPGENDSIKEVGKSPTFQEHAGPHGEAAGRCQSPVAGTRSGVDLGPVDMGVDVCTSLDPTAARAVYLRE